MSLTSTELLQSSVRAIVPGRWALAISGGADSTALLHLVRERADIEIVAVHLDHLTRSGQSTRDAEFVAALCGEMKIPLVLARRSELETEDLPANIQARYREMRLRLYRRAVGEHHCQGVLQAHHADDQAETVFMRLIRGGGIEAMGGIAADSEIDGLRIFRPLLSVRKSALLDYLRQRQLAWREDASNEAPTYLRNRVRAILRGREDLVAALLEVQRAFGTLTEYLQRIAPPVAERIPLEAIESLHPLLQLHVLRQWCLKHGAIAEDLSLELLDRVRGMIEDRALGPSVPLPGAIEVRRRSGELVIVAASATPMPKRPR